MASTELGVTSDEKKHGQEPCRVSFSAADDPKSLDSGRVGLSEVAFSFSLSRSFSPLFILHAVYVHVDGVAGWRG